jgi:hypothetical protein
MKAHCANFNDPMANFRRKASGFTVEDDKWYLGKLFAGKGGCHRSILRENSAREKVLLSFNRAIIF